MKKGILLYLVLSLLTLDLNPASAQSQELGSGSIVQNTRINLRDWTWENLKKNLIELRSYNPKDSSGLSGLVSFYFPPNFAKGQVALSVYGGGGIEYVVGREDIQLPGLTSSNNAGFFPHLPPQDRDKYPAISNYPDSLYEQKKLILVRLSAPRFIGRFQSIARSGTKVKLSDGRNAYYSNESACSSLEPRNEFQSSFICISSKLGSRENLKILDSMITRSYPSSNRAKSSRTVSFRICQESQTWVRPSKTEQIARLKSLPRYAGHEVNTKYWTDNIFLFSSYGLSARHEPIYLSGLWSIIDSILDCYNPSQVTRQINSGELAEVWLLQHRVIKIKWQNNSYIMIVAPTKTGAQFIHFSRIDRRPSVNLKVVTENGRELATLSASGNAIETRHLPTRISNSEKQKPNSQRLTWREFVERGGNREIHSDYDLPQQFRNGYVYFNYGAHVVTAYILKEGLSSYPSIPTSGIQQIDYELGDRYVKAGKAIRLDWDFGYNQMYNNRNKLVFDKERGIGCLGITCLTAPYLTHEQISRILHSKRSIEPQNRVP